MLTRDDLRDRETGPAASSIGAILGLSPFATPLSVWLEVTGRATARKDEEALRMGHALEPVIRNEYAHRFGVDVAQVPRAFRAAGEITFSAAADGMVTAADGGIGLECKSHRIFLAHTYGAPGTDDVPPHEWIQCQIGAWAYRVDRWDLGVLLDNRPRFYHLTHDEQRVGQIVEAVSRWWRDHVIADAAPPPTGKAADERAIAAWLPRQQQPLRPASVLEAHLIDQLRHARAVAKRAELARDKVEQQLKLSIGDADGIEFSEPDPATGAPITRKLTWRRAADSIGPDYRAMLVEYENRVQLAASGLPETHRKKIPLRAERREIVTRAGSRRFTAPRSWTAGLDDTEED